LPAENNIILILTDQQRLSAVGAYGATPCCTPNIDRLAAEGIRFETAYAAQPVCSPERASLMTGLYSHAHGMSTNVGELGCTMHHLHDSPSLLSRRLEDKGFQLGYSGKWHLCPEEDVVFGQPGNLVLPKDLGFEGQNITGNSKTVPETRAFKAYLAERGLTYEIVPWQHETVRVRPAGYVEGSPECSIPAFVTESTLGLIRKFKKNPAPFFIWHNFWGPHEPYIVPREYFEMYRDVEIPPWPNYDWPARSIPGPHQVKLTSRQERLRWTDWEMLIRYYYAYATLIDDQVGRIYAALEQEDLLDSTTIIFAADHGETLGSHGGLFDKGWHHFEETHRIPLIVRMPGGAGAGSVRSEFTSFIDLYPTILDLAGVPADAAKVHGRSFVPMLNGESPEWREHVVTEFGGVNNTATTQRTLCCGNLKFGFNIDAADELYDLDRDPYETRNLIAHSAYARQLIALRRMMEQWMDETNDPALFRYRHQLRYHESTGY
jgi:arylsulfatase A-like enzyme